jgi:hypothetical protein
MFPRKEQIADVHLVASFPPQHNCFVRKFNPATFDRTKHAKQERIHPSIISQTQSHRKDWFTTGSIRDTDLSGCPIEDFLGAFAPLR